MCLQPTADRSRYGKLYGGKSIIFTYTCQAFMNMAQMQVDLSSGFIHELTHFSLMIDEGNPLATWWFP